MATLTGELISETYDSLLKVTDNNTITGIKKRITDGFGNDIPLLLSSTDLEIDGTLILSALTDLAPATKFLSLKVDNSVGFRTASELLSDIGGASSSSISGTTGRLSKFTSTGAVGNSILNEIGNAIHLTDGTSSYASFGINNPGIDNDAYIGSTINNDFLIKVNNTEALRIDTALRLKIATIQNALGDTDKFLVSEDGVVKYRTGDELRADIGAGVGSVTSVGLSMPVAFSVANSPITSSGTLEVTAVGTASQYIRGDGQLATLPTGAGGGSAVNYYLNGSVNASVATYKQMSNTAIIGAGTDFNLTGNGLIAQFLTDLNNPNRLLIPGGAWNLELFFSTNSAGGSEKFYVELLKYNGTTFTSVASGITTPEAITGGTATDLYLTSIAVPETVLLATDRLAIRVYILDNSGGRTVTLHTEDNTLCQVTTTFAGGISALNGLTANTQYFAVGTLGTDFAISSLLDTHTFNLPTSSATNRGALSSANWTTFNNKQNPITLTTTGSSGVATLIGATLNIPNYGSALSGYVPYSGAASNVNLGLFNLTATNGYFSGLNTSALEINSGTGQYIDFYSSTTKNASIGFNVYTSSLRLDSGSTGGSNNTEFYVNAIKWLSASATGDATLTKKLTIDSGLGSNPSFASTVNGLEITSDGSTASNRNIILKIASSTALSIDNSLNVAIGYTTNPSLYKLDVNGTGRFAGATTFSNNVSIGTINADIIGYGTTAILGILGASGNPANIQMGITGSAGATTTALGDLNFYGLNGGATVIGRTLIRGSLDGATNSTKFDFFTMSSGSLTSKLTIASTGAATFSSSVTVVGSSTLDCLKVGINSTHQILIGADSSYAEIQAITQGVGFNKNLILQRQGGNVGIGTTTPTRKLTVQGADDGTLQIRMQGTADTNSYCEIGRESASTGDFRINVARSGVVINAFKIADTTGAATFSNSVTATAFIPISDIRLKNLTDYNYNVKLIKLITYVWKDGEDKRKKIGYSAQQIKEILPDVVNSDEKGMLSVDYNQIFVAKIDMLENMIQELKAEIDILKNK